MGGGGRVGEITKLRNSEIKVESFLSNLIVHLLKNVSIGLNPKTVPSTWKRLKDKN